MNGQPNKSSGMVSIVGRPNVGKSTLLNSLIGRKIAIVSKVPQTTRVQVRGVYNDERGQIVFIDTPGLHPHRDRLDEFMNRSADESARGADCVIHLVDATDHTGPEEEELVRRLSRLSMPIILGLNKVDLNAKHMSDYIALWERVRGCPVTEFKDFTLLPLSAKGKTNIEKLRDILFEILPEGPPLYPQDMVSDTPKKMMISDVIREKIYHRVRQEIPHSIAVMIEEMGMVKGGAFRIDALVLVERDSQKKIVIGKKGENLKLAGTAARRELEESLGQKVFLNLHVKVAQRWRESPSYLQDLGYDCI
ncbi:MAG: GTPase Era [Candidatus Omnitrophota bacterium]